MAVRVVHGGPKFKEITLVSDEVLTEIKKYTILASLHNTVALKVINLLLTKFDENTVHAAFDTGFFTVLPIEAKTFALGSVETPLQIQKYGFCKISCQTRSDSFVVLCFGTIFSLYPCLILRFCTILRSLHYCWNCKCYQRWRKTFAIDRKTSRQNLILIFALVILYDPV